jgi:hypothetical protein
MALFYNYSTEKFTHTWGGVPFSFEPGKVYSGVIVSDDGQSSLTINDVLARFFAKHLATFVLDKNLDVGKDPMKYNFTNVELLTERGISAPSVVLPMPSFAAELPVASEKKEEIVESVVEEAVVEKKKSGRFVKKEEASPSGDAAFDL